MSSERPQAVIAQRKADLWFREQGLPTFVPLRRWFTDLPRRVAPLIFWVALVSLLLGDGLDDVTDIVITLSDGEFLIAALVVIILLLCVGLAWGGYIFVRWMLRHLPVVVGTVAACVIILGCIASLISAGYLDRPNATVGPVFQALLVIGVCCLVTGMGGGSLISWASRLAVRNASAIGHMASIALPVILMLVVFAFFSAEVWQMASALHWGSVALIGLVVAVLAGVVVLRVSASEIDDEAHAPSDEQRRALLADSPAAHLTAAPVSRGTLKAPQRMNILLALTFAQLLQALFFAGLLCVLLIVIGSIAVPVGVVELWVGPGSATQPMVVEKIMIGSAELPITVNLLKAATLLSLIATLPFVFSAVSEARYRERFFDPIMADMRRAIVVREALGGTTNPGPSVASRRGRRRNLRDPSSAP